MRKIIHIFDRHFAPALAVGALVLSVLSSCFTGIESTKKIELSKEDKRLIQTTIEDTFLNDITATPVSQWEIGKKFYATENRTALIFESSHVISDIDRLALGGKTLTYIGTEQKTMIDGTKSIVINFNDNLNNLFHYNTRKSDIASVYSSDLPMMIDMDIVDRTASRLIGLNLWTLTSLWYDANGESVNGKKFVPITITEIRPGDKVFPIKVIFSDENGNTYSMLMNVGNCGIESRSFANLFTFKDPRLRFPDIDADVWRMIQNAQIRNGMSKDECRLALGAPKEVNKGHNYSSTLELWQYTDGVYLQFQDGILVNFRR